MPMRHTGLCPRLRAGIASVLIALVAMPLAAQEQSQGPSDTSAYQLIQLLNQNETLTNEISLLRGQIEELMQEAQRARESQKRIATDFDARISTIEAKPETDTSEDKARIAKLESRIQQLEQALTAMHELVAQAASEPVRKSAAETTYESALEKYRTGDLGNAILDFEAFLQHHADDPSAVNARYWMAEAQLQQGEFENAIDAGRTLLQRYPDSDKAADTMFLIGKAYLELGDASGARRSWEELVRFHSGSAPADKARALLQQLP